MSFMCVCVCFPSFSSSFWFEDLFSFKVLYFIVLLIQYLFFHQNKKLVQPRQYINTLLVPRDGEIPVDKEWLASHGIYEVVCGLYFTMQSSCERAKVILFKLYTKCFPLDFKWTISQTASMFWNWLSQWFDFKVFDQGCHSSKSSCMWNL